MSTRAESSSMRVEAITTSLDRPFQPGRAIARRIVRGSSPRENKVTSRKMQTHDTTWLELEPSCRSIVGITLTASNSRPPVERVSERTGDSCVIPGKWARPGRSTMLIRYCRQNKVSWLTLALLSRLANLMGCQSDGKVYYFPIYDEHLQVCGHE